MDSKKRFRRVLAAALAVLLSAAPVVRVSAEETTETEIILEPTAPAEQIPPEMSEEPVIPETTENSPEPEIPEDPETTEDLGIYQEPAALSWAENVAPMTAAEALAQPTGTENVPVVCATEVCATEVYATEACATEVCATEVCATEVYATEECATEVCATDVCVTEVCSI